MFNGVSRSFQCGSGVGKFSRTERTSFRVRRMRQGCLRGILNAFPTLILPQQQTTSPPPPPHPQISQSPPN